MNETWKWVVGYKGIYKISNLGRVLSVARYDERGNFRNETQQRTWGWVK